METPRVLAFDLETDSVVPDGRILAIAMANSDGATWYFDFAKLGMAETFMLKFAQAWGEHDVVVAHNLPFDLVWLQYKGLLPPTIDPLDPKWRCTRVLGSMVSTGPGDPTDLDALARKFLGKKKIEFDHKAEHTAEELKAYALRDVELTWELYLDLIEAVDPALYLFRMEVLLALMSAQARGVQFDFAHSLELEDHLQTWADLLESRINGGYDFLPDDLNLGSPKQLGDLLDSMGVVLPSTPSGQRCVNAEALQAVREDEFTPAPVRNFLEDLQELRDTKKKLATFVRGFAEKCWADGRLHTTYTYGRDYEQGGGAITWRTSSSSPNLQNMPRSDDVRGQLIPDTGCLFAIADYSQIELRVAAWLSDDHRMQEAFRNDHDPHLATTAAIMGRPYEELVEILEEDGDEAPEVQRLRVFSKTVNFAKLYGGTYVSIGKTLKKSGYPMRQAQVKDFIRTWDSLYPYFNAWAHAVSDIANDQGVVRSPIGGERSFPRAHSGYEAIKNGRQAVNFLCQSTAADLTNAAITEWVARFGDNWPFVGQVHDEIWIQYPATEDPDKVSYHIRETMERSAQQRISRLTFSPDHPILRTPLRAEVHTGLQRLRKV